MEHNLKWVTGYARRGYPESPLVERGNFREDLFYRLNVIPIIVPPLRERREDIIPLVNHFIGKYNQKLKREIRGFSPEALRVLLNNDWTGNVRELENFVERAVALTSSELITPSDLTASLRLGSTPTDNEEYESEETTLDSTYKVLEKEQILRSLEENGWNRAKAADELGISRTFLWRKMKKYSLKKPS